jgi:hypothetical protein
MEESRKEIVSPSFQCRNILLYSEIGEFHLLLNKLLTNSIELSTTREIPSCLDTR